MSPAVPSGNHAKCSMLHAPRSIPLLCVLVVVTVLMPLGCATRRDVAEIVKQSNQQISEAMQDANSAVATATLPGGIPDIDTEGRQATPTDWQRAVAQIEAFITAHPNLTRTTNALRVRQAILYLSAEQRNLALRVFQEIDTSQLANARDKALVDVHETLVWWYSVTGPTVRPFSAADRQSAQQGLEQLARVSAGLTESPGVQRFLGQMRVRIANRLASSLSNPADIKHTLQDGLGQYAAQFTAPEQRLIQNWHLNKTDTGSPPLPGALRWYDYVPKAFQEAERIWRASSQETPDFTPPWVACILKGACL